MIYKKRIFGKTKQLTIEELTKKINSLEYIQIALLFGSRSRGDFTIQSDYDFAILTDEQYDTSWGHISKVWNELGDILGLAEYDYDIVDLDNANRAIIDSIKESYILLKGDRIELQRLFDKYN
jgi:predicted nucleotidyltransferase